MGRDHRNIEMDWLDVRGFVEWSTNEVTQATIGQTRFWEYKEAVNTILIEATMGGVVFGLIMGTLLMIIWIERKLIARLMDRRGAMTSMRSLWAGESGLDAGEWWRKIPYGIGGIIGRVIRLLQRIVGNASKKPTVDRVNDRSYLGWPLLPGMFQNVADGVKLLQKEWMVPRNADRMMFEAAPIIIISSTVVILGLIPLGPGIYGPDLQFGVLFAMAVFGVAPLGIFFAAWASNNKYALIGGIRSAAQLTAYEIPLLLVVLSVCIVSGSFNFREIVQDQIDAHTWNVFIMPIGFLLFITAMVAEVERTPFDMPEAEAELVEGWWTEYGGLRWGLLFAVEYLRTYAACILTALFFLGGWQAPFAGLVAATPGIGDQLAFIYGLIPGVAWVLIKAWFVFTLFVWIRAALPRVRTDQILEFGWRWLLPLSVLNVLIAGIMRLFLHDPSVDGWFTWNIIPTLLLGSIPFMILIAYTSEEGENAARPEPILVTDLSHDALAAKAKHLGETDTA